jgi:hypothetical protein
MKAPADDRSIFWVWEPTGGKGKTVFQKHLFTPYTDRRIIVLSSKASDMKNGIIEYAEKNGALPEIILVNKPRCAEQQCVSFQGLEEIKDKFFFSGKYKGGMVCGPSPHVCVLANEPPEWNKFSSDRWRVFRIDDVATPFGMQQQLVAEKPPPVC